MENASLELPAAPSVLIRPAARLWGAARVLARHADEMTSPARARLLAELDDAADSLAEALGGRGLAPDPADDLDEALLLRCACL